jgi:opacity protein-like surface antigen
MRKVLLSLAASMALATPAFANEARFEGRGGVIWDQGEEEAIAGIAAGYDFDLGSNAFAGPEISADKILTDGTKVSFGFGARAGIKTSEAGKLYAVGSYQTEACDTCEHTWTLGAGYQHAFGQNFYGKAEYRHFFADNNVSDPDAVTVGVGYKF